MNLCVEHWSRPYYKSPAMSHISRQRPRLSLLHSPNKLLLAQQDLQAKIAMLEVYKILGVLKTQGNSKIQDNILGTCNIPSPLPHSQHPR